jgi:hypothetical protein
MNLAGLNQAIIARVRADTGAGGLWATGARLINAISYTFEARGDTTGVGVAMPYVTFEMTNSETRDGYGFDLQEIYMRFHVWYAFLRNKDAAITAAANIVDRLYGNALAINTRVPSYGFHRHLLVLTTTGIAATPWATGMMWKTSSNEAHEHEALHFIETYRLNMSRVVAA